jgi:hypothetical protein
MTSSIAQKVLACEDQIKAMVNRANFLIDRKVNEGDRGFYASKTPLERFESVELPEHWLAFLKAHKLEYLPEKRKAFVQGILIVVRQAVYDGEEAYIVTFLNNVKDVMGYSSYVRGFIENLITHIKSEKITLEQVDKLIYELLGGNNERNY